MTSNDPLFKKLGGNIYYTVLGEKKRKMSASHEKSPNRAAPQQQQSALFDLWLGRQFVQTWPVGRGTFEPKLHLGQKTDVPWRIWYIVNPDECKFQRLLL